MSVALAIVGSGALGIAFATRLAGKCLDDLFITFRYAENLARGDGLVFNLGERVFSLTNPGLALILAGAKVAFGADIPQLATWLTAISLVLLAGILGVEASGRRRCSEAVAGTLMLSGSSFIWASHGFEFLPALAIVAVASQLLQRMPLLAGVLAGFGVWCRPEVLIAVLLLAWFSRRDLRALPGLFVLGSTLVTVAGLVSTTLYFGQPMPLTLAAKLATVATEPTQWTGFRFWLRSAPLLARHLGPHWWAVGVLGALGLIDIVGKGGRMEKTLVSFGISVGLLYPLLGVPFSSWYAVPTLAAVLYAVPFAHRALGCSVAIRFKRAIATVMILFTLLAVGPAYVASYRWLANYEWPSYMKVYREAGLWLRANTEPKASVAYYEVGVLGYFSDRHIVDILGIVSPHLVPYVRRGDLASAFLAEPASWVLFHTRRGGRMPVGHRWFRRNYREIMRFPDGEESLILYRQRRHTKLPRPEALSAARAGGRRGGALREPAPAAVPAVPRHRRAGDLPLGRANEFGEQLTRARK